MSPHVVDALVAMEDQRFFTNIGFDIFGISRAAITCAL
ncbi:transglycosylase domain-containing protein [Candidatus Peribacteria bacterium]|nr:transglycosylase domain-containing protein [Candidatus Peribacteria bacterium]